MESYKAVINVKELMKDVNNVLQPEPERILIFEEYYNTINENNLYIDTLIMKIDKLNPVTYLIFSNYYDMIKTFNFRVINATHINYKNPEKLYRKGIDNTYNKISKVSKFILEYLQNKKFRNIYNDKIINYMIDEFTINVQQNTFINLIE